jgi:hypothetical protein
VDGASASKHVGVFKIHAQLVILLDPFVDECDCI